MRFPLLGHRSACGRPSDEGRPPAPSSEKAFLVKSAEIDNFNDQLRSEVAFIGASRALGPYQLSMISRAAGPVGPALIDPMRNG